MPCILSSPPSFSAEFDPGAVLGPVEPSLPGPRPQEGSTGTPPVKAAPYTPPAAFSETGPAFLGAGVPRWGSRDRPLVLGLAVGMDVYQLS